MKIENETIVRGMTVYYPKPTSVSVSYKSCEVVDTNEPMKAVKILYYVGPVGRKRGKTEWFPLSKLRLSPPAKEVTP